MKFACATKRYSPRIWKDRAGFFDRETFRLIPVAQQARSVLMGLDANTDFDSYAVLPRDRRTLQRFIHDGYACLCAENAPLSPFQRLRRVDTPYIRELHWAVTGRCNLLCRHCFMCSPQGKYGQTEREDMLRVLSMLEAANVACVSLTGGEPLLYPHLRELIAGLSAKGIAVNEVVTNGVLLDEELLRFLQEHDQKPMFQISLDGVGMHDHMRGIEGAEQKALRAIELCTRHGFFTAVTSVFSRENIDTLEACYEQMKRLRVSAWLIGRAQTTGLWKGGPMALSTDEMGRALLRLQRRWLEEGRPISILMENFYEASPGSSAQAKDVLSYTPDDLECAETRDRLFLMPDGRLLPCPGFAGTALEERMPRIQDADLLSLRADSALARFCAQTRRERYNANPECQKCEWFSQCGMGCRAYALTENGGIMRKDIGMCEMYRDGWRARFLAAQTEYGGHKHG